MPPDFVVPDANVLIALCAQEADKFVVADAKMQEYAEEGSILYAPGVLVAEVLYILCGKLMRGVLSPAEHSIAVQSLQAQMHGILPPPGGDAALVLRAEQIRGTYGCSRSADGLYIATAEQLTQQGTVELVTFDVDLSQQVAANVPAVRVCLLPVK